MTTTTTIPESARTDTREQRGLALYRERGHEIRRFGAGLYRVPSCSGEGFYTVNLFEDLEEWCNCPDHSRHPQASCKHILAVVIHHAKRRGPCAGCGRRFRHRDMVECVEGNHDGLTYFEGDRLCRACADNAAVAY